MGFAAGCTSSVALDVPVSDGDSAVVALRAPEVEPRLYAVDVDERLPDLVVDRGTTLLLMTLDGPLAKYGLVAGPVERERAPSSGRPLPTAASLFDLEPPFTSWQPTDALPADVAAFLIPELPSCDRSDACVHLFEERPICAVPCPTTSPIVPPTPPMAPAPSMLTCAAGFTSAAEGCRPAPRRDCPDDEAQPLDAASCGALVACPSTPYRPSASPLGTVHYVSSSASAGGDGTIDAPFDSIAAALATATPPMTLLLGEGTFDATSLTGDVVLRGRCPESTTLRGALTSDANVTIDGVRWTTPSATIAGELTVVDAIVVGAEDVVSLTTTGPLVALRSRFTRGSIGVRVADASLESVTFDGQSDAAIDATGTVTIDGAVVEGTVRATDAEVSIARAWFATSAPAIDGRGSARFDLRDVHVDGVFVRLSDSAQLTATNTSVTQPGASELSGTSALTISDGRWTDAGSLGLRVGDSASASLSRMALVGDARTFVLGRGASRVSLTDIDADAHLYLAEVTENGALELARVETTGRIRAGVADGDGYFPYFTGVSATCDERGAPSVQGRSTLELEDVVIDGATGNAVMICPGATADLRRLEVRESTGGVAIDCRQSCSKPEEIATVTIEDFEMIGGEASRVGIIQRGGTLDIQRAAIRDVTLYGLYVWGAVGTTMDLIIDGVGADAPTDTMALDVYCSENRQGRIRGPASAVFTEAWTSPFAYETAEVFLERFRLSSAACSGIAPGVDGTFTANDGAIVENLRGVNFIRFAEPEIGEDVVFRDNRQADIYEAATD